MRRSGVIQAFFPERPLPSGTAHRRFVRTVLPPHPATIAQPRPAFGAASRPPHPATVAPARTNPGAHARAAQPKGADVHAFQVPQGFLDGRQGKGDPLPTSLKLQMERYFDADLSDVRVHVGGEAASIGALAFTLGSDIYFAPEQYQPHTSYGRELLGHELTHVLQQREGRVANPFGDGVAVVQDWELEAEADRHGKAAAQNGVGGKAGYRAGPAQPRAAGIQAKGGYRLHVGAYMHDEPMPEKLAGHSFVAIEGPDGQRQAFGFSPAHYGRYDPARDLGRLSRGVEGVVHDDATAFDRPGVKTKSYDISREQAQAAMRKVEEYRSQRTRYSAEDRQCSTFTLDVMRAARLPALGEDEAPPPRLMYEAIDDA